MKIKPLDDSIKVQFYISTGRIQQAFFVRGRYLPEPGPADIARMPGAGSAFGRGKLQKTQFDRSD